MSATASSQDTKPQPQWPDISKPDTRGGGAGPQKKSFDMTTRVNQQASSGLMLELLDWLASRPRTYAEAIEAWRTNCPRLSVWDDALTDGLVRVVRGAGTGSRSEVTLTALGRMTLDGRSDARPRAAAAR